MADDQSRDVGSLFWELLNPQLDAWRKHEEIALPSDRAVPGTFDWMVAVYA
jgi:hypothetical protein